MSDREHQLEAKVEQQEAELRRLQEEVIRLRHEHPLVTEGNSAASAAAPHSAASHAANHQSAAAVRKARYMYAQFPASLLAPPSNGPQLYPCEGLSAIAHEGRVVLFGGTNGSTITHDTVSYNLATGRWRRLIPSSPSGQMPTPRYGHSAVLYHNTMIVYGGFGPGGITQGAASTQTAGTAARPVSAAATRTGLLNSLYSLDLHTGDWTCLSSFVEGQLPTKNHSAVLHGSKMYVFGGCLPDGRTNAIRCYDVDKKQWYPTEHLNAQAIQCNALAGKSASPAAAANAATVAGQLALSDIPAPRSGHAAALVVRSGSPLMVVFGGRLSKFVFSNDVFQYDLGLQTWMRLYCGGDIPEGRCDHTAVVYRDTLIVYGGYAVHDDGSKRYFNDVHALDLVTCTWSRVELVGPSTPLGSCGHASVLFETTDNVVCMATFGGWGIVPDPVSLADEDAERVLRQHEGDISYRTINDVWVFQVAKAIPPAAASTNQQGSSRPTSARHENGRAVSPRQPATRPSTARSTRSFGMSSIRSAAATHQPRQGGPTRPAFVTHSSKATTAKVFGDAPMNDRMLRMAQTQGSPKRSPDEVQSILGRLTNTKIHEGHLEALRKKHMRQVETTPLTSDEQQEITDRLYYQQLMLQEERRKVLRSKYVPVQEREPVPNDQIEEIVTRLVLPIDRPTLETARSPPRVSKQQTDQLLKKLYVDDQKYRKDLNMELEKKYVWGPPAPKLSAAEVNASIQRLVEPITPRRK